MIPANIMSNTADLLLVVVLGALGAIAYLRIGRAFRRLSVQVGKRSRRTVGSLHSRASSRLSPVARARTTAIGGAQVEHPPLAPLSIDAQWRRVTGVVAAAVADAETVRELQISAERQLDAASYAMQRLMEELAQAMSLASSHEPIIVCRFEPQPRRTYHSALAA